MSKRFIWDEDLIEVKKEKMQDLEGKFFETKTIELASNRQKKVKKILKKKRRKRRLIKLSIFALLVAILTIFITLPKHQNPTYIVEGNMVITDNEIINEIQDFEKKNYFFNSKIYINYKLSKSKYIDSVKVEKKYPNEVKLIIDENNPVLITNENSTQFINYEDGTKEEYNKSPYYVNVGISKIENEIILKDTLNNLGKVDYRIISEIQSIEQINNGLDVDLLAIKMNDGSTVEIRSVQIKDKLKYFPTMKNEVSKKYGENQKGIYHLDVGNYFSPY